jgi:flavodoxin I
MAKIGLFYGSSTGNTEFVAYQIKEALEGMGGLEVEVTNIGETSPEKMLSYQYLIMGVPTWNTGQLQDDWEFFMPRIQEMDFAGRKVAIFGLGDQNGYGFNFLDAVGTLGDQLLLHGAEMYGLWPTTKNYEYEESKAQVEDHFLGLGIDQDGQEGMTPARIQEWVKQVREEFGV